VHLGFVFGQGEVAFFLLRLPVPSELRTQVTRKVWQVLVNIGLVTGISSPGAISISTITGDPVARIAADATVADVAKALVAGDVGAIVVGDDALPAALVSERDVVRVVASGKDPAAVPASDIASTKLVWCDAESTVSQVATRMMDHYIRHVLVERDGALAGIVSARDLLGVYSAYGADPDLDSA